MVDALWFDEQGLDNAGKTTLMHMLKDQRLATHQPTQYPTSEELSLGTIKFKAFDLGGHKAARSVWKDYYVTVDAVVFLVDASDTDRLPEAAKELNGLLSEESMQKAPFLVLGNKIDLRGACHEQQLRNYLGLRTTTGKDKQQQQESTSPFGASGVSMDAHQAPSQPIEIFMCSVKKRQGYKEGFQWLSQHLT